MTDADVDGSHIATLMLTFFFRKMEGADRERPRLPRHPALYLVKKGQAGTLLLQRNTSVRPPWPNSARDRTYSVTKVSRRDERPPAVGDDDESDTRILRQVNIENAAEADRIFSMLMGDEVPPRREFIEKNAHYANIDA